jgi:phospholipase C
MHMTELESNATWPVGKIVDAYFDLRAFHGWYDLRVTVDTDASFERTLAGHVETGRSSMCDPAFGMS